MGELPEGPPWVSGASLAAISTRPCAWRTGLGLGLSEELRLS